MCVIAIIAVAIVILVICIFSKKESYADLPFYDTANRWAKDSYYSGPLFNSYRMYTGNGLYYSPRPGDEANEMSRQIWGKYIHNPERPYYKIANYS